jgi:tetratricopeptide (TPR) repeat protein
MTPAMPVAVAVLFLLACTTKAASPTDPEKDPQMSNLVTEAWKLIVAKNPRPAIEKCDEVITRYKTYYGSRQEKVYGARTSAESLGYLLKAAADNDKGQSKAPKAIVISSTWGDAHFSKGYALQDLGRIGDAKAEIMAAVELSPWNCKYLCELGSIYQTEKNWAKAREAFETAEGQASLGPDNVKAAELAQARRGLGYVLVELGQLDEAEKKYEQCLAADPKDAKAARELEYVRNLRARKSR